ncbi:MAG: outer membrane protein [Bacteroidota bacterium]
MKPVLISALLLVSSGAFAQGLSPVSFGIHGNAATINVAEPLKDVYGAGFGGGAHLDIDLVILSLRISGDYIAFSPDDAKFLSLMNAANPGANFTSIDGGSLSIISGHVNGKLPILPLPVVTPYVTGGIGLARIGFSDVDVASASGSGTATFDSETKTAVNLGAGVDLKLGVSLFVEARYTWILTEGETSTYIPVTVGITF